MSETFILEGKVQARFPIEAAIKEKLGNYLSRFDREHSIPELQILIMNLEWYRDLLVDIDKLIVREKAGTNNIHSIIDTH